MIRLAVGLLLASSLLAESVVGNFSIVLSPGADLPKGATVTAIDSAGGRVVAPVARHIRLHLAAPLARLEWHPAPPPSFTFEPAAPYVPALVLSHDRAPLPFFDPHAIEHVTIRLLGADSTTPPPALPLLPLRAHVAVVTSWDDGHPNDLRLARLLGHHGFAGTFFLNENSHARRHDLPALTSLGMEIGSHTVNHPAGWKLSPAQWLAECLQMRLSLEADLGHPVVSFAYPYNHTPAHDAEGDYVLRAVRGSGYQSGRNTHVRGRAITDYPEPLSFSTDGHFRMSDEAMEKAWQRASRTDGGVLYFWGHSSELRSPEDWQALDARLALYARRPGTWYATQGQLFLWRWLRENARWTRAATPAEDGIEFTIEFPRLAPHWRQLLPLTVQLPPGVTRVAHAGSLVDAEAAQVVLPDPKRSSTRDFP
jgi:peptidoglycan/xylan/chitin deacetylase (PgdA/CDA1 family)